MKMRLYFLSTLALAIGFLQSTAQDEPQSPAMISTAIYHDVVGPLLDFPALTPEELASMAEKEAGIKRNQDLKVRHYPFYDETRPLGPDPGLQSETGSRRGLTSIIQHWAGQSGFSNPPDCNGTAGPNHYMQTINVKYTIYDKTGTLLAGPTNLNTLFSGVPGSQYNDGDPIVLFDEQAQKWLVAEFAGVWSNPDYMLIAVSQTNDPTGLWDRWSFVMNGFPDYMKFGIWRDGYYMGTNTFAGDDIYVFERDVMIAGGSSPQMVQFNNPYRPNSGFHCVLPVDNDGAFAPAGTPGMFITINDNAWGGSAQDQLWLYELDVDWTTPSNSTFSRVQQINVASFDSNFGSTWENIRQPGTGQKLDAIPQVLMHRAQYRNFGSSQHIVCNHTVDVNGADQAGIRWYELDHNGSQWEVRQYGTYAPDADSRWMGSIAMNANHEIALGYSVSSNTTYPGIRYAGQSAAENANATGILDLAEVSVFEGTASQTSSERWGDYSNMAIDPVDTHIFWFTTQYNISGSQKGTRIASFEFASAPLANFVADNLTPSTTDTVNLTDLSSGSPVSWAWDFTPATITYLEGTSATSQNPIVRFNAPGFYTVELTATNSLGSGTETKVDYIEASQPLPAPVADFVANNTTPLTNDTVVFTDMSTNSPTAWEWTFTPSTVSYLNGTSFSTQHPELRFDDAGYYTVQLTATNNGGSGTEIKMDYIHVTEGMSVSATASPGEICKGEWSQLEATPTGGSGTYTYSWTSDPPGFTSSLQNPLVTPVINTLYMVDVSDGSQSASAAVTVVVNPLPEIILGDWPEMICNVGVPPLQLTAIPVGGEYSGTGVSPIGVFTSWSAELGWNVITYTYEDDNGCVNSALDSIYVDDCVGIGENDRQMLTVNLYPNPGTGFFKLDSENDIDRIEIIDQSGKMVMMRKIGGKSTSITALRSKGLYFVRIYTADDDGRPLVIIREFIIR
jgi:PKD repeat protein